MPKKVLTMTLAIIAVQLIGPISCKYSAEELKAINQLRKTIGVNNLYHDYMKSDQYLMSFLKARKMNVKNAVEMLEKSLKWRKENNIDSVVDEKDCDQDYPFRSDIIDKLGRPALEMSIKEWDVRKHMIAGKAKQFYRCEMRFFEIMNAKVRQQNAEFGGDEKNITQWAFIVNLQGYNVRQHACTPCLSAYVSNLIGIEANYPNSVHTFYLLNTPSIFESVLKFTKHAMSEKMRESLKIYGFDSTEWKKVLLDTFPGDQLSPYYGGTKTR